MKTMTFCLLLAAAASAASAAEPAVLDECLKVTAAARNTAPGTYEVGAILDWTCDPAAFGTGIAKMTVNDVPVGPAISYDASAPATMRVTVTSATAPLKVCVQAGAFDAAGNPTVSAKACTSAPVLSTVSATTPRVGSTTVLPRRR